MSSSLYAVLAAGFERLKRYVAAWYAMSVDALVDDGVINCPPRSTSDVEMEATESAHDGAQADAV